MKILKPGKFEMRKFVCTKCGCIFVANDAEKYFLRRLDGSGKWVVVDCVCGVAIPWADAEPYEEPTQDTEADAKKIVAIAQQWLRDDRTASLWRFADKLIDNGVTFREG